jgi:FkbM family methyltransferase
MIRSELCASQETNVTLSTLDQANLAAHQQLLRRFRALRRIRPGALSAFLIKVMAPDERRRVVQTASGLRLYVDPFTHLGGNVVDRGTVEPETEWILREHLREGDTFLDIGANEGYFSALASRLVGAPGMVISVEPQSRLCGLIEINLRLNAAGQFRVYNNAIGGDEGTQGIINLWPSFNTGSSSIVSRYRFSRRTEMFTYVSIERILSECGRPRLDFVKIDVEGFEGQVIAHMSSHLKERRVGKLFVDYHAEALRAHQVSPMAIHQSIIDAGYQLVLGSDKKLSSYNLYAVS